MTASAMDVIAPQQRALEALYRTHVGPGDRYALLDFPDHANVGDSAIWLGEVTLLRRITGRDPDHVATWDGFDMAAFRADSPEGVVFLHGGGNLGDIWPHHQRFRDRIVRDLRDRRVVQLPQSIHFRDAAGIAAFGDTLARHPDFHLCVRDERSLLLAQAHWSCPVTLAPDSAFALGPQPRGAADLDVLMLLRTDQEGVPHEAAVRAGAGDAAIVDWLIDDVLPMRAAGESLASHYHRLADARVARGLALLSRGRRIVTDRLHAHILAVLLGVPHRALDNEYGKLSAYIAAWTAASPLLEPAAPR